jgi:hypothetical protein
MTLFKNTVVALIIVITTSAGAVAGYVIGMKQENRRLNELLRDTHIQLSGVIQNDATAGDDAIRYRQQGADGLLTAFGRNQNGNTATAGRQETPSQP